MQSDVLLQNNRKIANIKYWEVLHMKKSILIKLTPFYVLIISIFLLITLLGDRAVTVAKLNNPIHTGRYIIIDAGHGGEDGGATS